MRSLVETVIGSAFFRGEPDRGKKGDDIEEGKWCLIAFRRRTNLGDAAAARGYGDSRMENFPGLRSRISSYPQSSRARILYKDVRDVAAFVMHDDNEQDDDEAVASFSPKRKKKQTNSMLLDLDSAEQISPGFLSSLRYKTRSLTS